MSNTPRWIATAYVGQGRLLPASLERISALPAWLALLPVLAVGLAFRLWDIARPFIGYHSWNEVYYTAIARNFEHFGLLAPYNYSWLGGATLGPRYGPAPFVPWLIYFSSRVLGNAEWAARMPILVLGLCSLVMIYLIARELYDTRVALVAAAVGAVMPGVVFFSRQVSLDGPMAAFGLGAVWTLLVARRTGRVRWLLASGLLLGIAVFVKYTAVLFVPCIAWIWWTMLVHQSDRRFHWWELVVYIILSVLPAVAWLAFGRIVSPAGTAQDPSSAYLNRTYEWNLTGWGVALVGTWTRLSEQVGRILWYPLALASVWAVAAQRGKAILKAHTEVILLVIPWFAQLVYPYSWSANEAYTYPALYGIAILLGIIVKEALRLVPRLPGVSGRHLHVAAPLLIVVIALSCLLDYWQVYHSWYTYDAHILQRPANAVTLYSDPFASARLIRAINVSHQPVLADLPATLYYAQDEAWKGSATWWWWGLGEEYQMIRAINSRGYAYVVFTYDPPVSIADALATNGYRRVGPAAWERVEQW